MRTTQPGYGVVVPEERARRNVGPSADDGFYLTDTATGRCRMLVSIKDMVERANPAIQSGDLSRQEIYGFHSKFNPQSTHLMLSLRWFPALEKRRWDMFAVDYREVRYAWITMPLDASVMHCAVGPEQWDKGGHHGTFFPDGEHISMNLAIDRDVLRFVQVNFDGSGLRKMRDDTVGSGHPTVHRNGTHLLTDTYEGESMAYGDGTIPLRWIELATGKEQALVRMNIRQPHAQGALRIDPHPAWDRTWRYVTFNGSLGGTRRVFVADMGPVLSLSGVSAVR